MFTNVLAPGNLPFAVALAVMLGIAALEGVFVLLGGGLSQIIESWLPDSVGEADLDVDAAGDASGEAFEAPDTGHAEIGSESALSRLLGWFHVGRVPVLVLLVLFLTVFGIAGLMIQALAAGLVGAMLPASLAAVPALACAIPAVRVLGRLIARLVPKDESEVVSQDAMLGRIARLTIGTARRGAPAEAKVRDGRGHTHYLMVEPLDDDDSCRTGEDLLIVARADSRYLVTRNTNAALVDR